MIRRSCCVSLFSIVFLTILHSSGIADDYSTWRSSRRLLLNTTGSGANISGNVRNVPVLVRLQPSTFADFPQTLDGGADIRFAKTDGTHLSYQIERWVDTPNHNDTAEIWVKIDTVYGNRISQSFVMYWGKPGAADSSNSAAVFDTANGFVGVWHLDEDPSDGTDAIKDASANQLDATAVGGMDNSKIIEGMIGRAHNFDGVDDGDSIPFAPQLNIADALTISAWINIDALQSYARIISRGMPTNELPWTIYSLNTNDSFPQIRGEVSTADTIDQLPIVGKRDLQTNTWYHVTMTYDLNALRIYRNGSQDSAEVAANVPIGITQTTPLMIGKSNYATNPFRGIIDEPRLERVARDGNWIKLCYENQRAEQLLIPRIASLTWDTSTASGTQPGGGTWGNSNRWSTNGTQLVPWLGRGTTARFSGTAGSYTVTVQDRQQVDSMFVSTTSYTFSDGILDFDNHSGIFIDAATTTIIGSEITGSSGLIKYGPGQLRLDGENTYSGPTAVASGTLLVNGSLDSGSAVTVAPGATLGGNGTIPGDVSAKGATIVPGNGGTGTLRMGSLVLDSSSHITVQLGTSSDSLVIAGSVTLDGGVTIVANSGFKPGTYRILTYSGTIRNDSLVVASSPEGRKCTFEYGPGYVAVVISSRILQSEPSDTMVLAGTKATFTASADGSGAITYRWERFPSDSVGSGTSFSIATTTTDDNGSRFRCIALDSFASDTSRWALLTVVDTPRIIEQPHDTTVLYGKKAILSFTLEDSTGCRYWWYKDSTEFIDSRHVLTIDSVSADDAGDYFCRISNTIATITTVTVHLTTLPPPPVAGFSATPQSGFPPLGVYFSDESTGEITGRTWDFGDGNSDTSTNPVHAYETSGLYSVKLTVTGPGGTDSEEKPNLIWVHEPGQNPLRIQAKYLGDTTVAIAIDTRSLSDTALHLTFDSLGIWMAPDTFPQSSSTATLVATHNLSELSAALLTDTLELHTSDSVVGLMTGLFLSDGSISEFYPANGTIVLLYDTIPSGVALQNALEFTSLIYDSATASLKISCRIDQDYIQNNLEVGIAYSLDAPPERMSGSQIMPMSTPTLETTLELPGPLQFDTTYYVAIFARIGDTEWPEPTDANRKSVTTGIPYRQVVTFFDTADTVTAFNGKVLLWKDTAAADFNVITDTLEVYTYIPKTGFAVVNAPFVFTKTVSSPGFYVGIRVTDLPAGASLNDIYFYRDSAGVITVDYSTLHDSSSNVVYKKVSGNDLTYPFIAMFDEQPPVVSRIGTPDSIAYPDEDLVDKIRITDNIANCRWTYLYSSGDRQPQTKGSGTLSETTAELDLTVAAADKAIDDQSGVRILLLVSDGIDWDTLNLSRPVARNQSDPTTSGNNWCPVYATAQLDHTDPDSLIARLSKSKKYDDRVLRLFRWYQTPSNQGSDSKWIEYNPGNESIRQLFTLTPGNLLWLKTWTDKPLHLGAARTLSCRDTFTITLRPEQFTDFGMPYRFGVYIRDILAAGYQKTDSVQFYIWRRDATDGRYYLDQLYQRDLPDKNDPLTVLSFSQGGGYSLYNPGKTPVTLRIPPTLAGETATAKKLTRQERGSSWSTKFIATTTGGTDLPALYCGYAPGLTKDIFPVAPTFSPVQLCTIDRTSGKKLGHFMRDDAADGVIREIRVANTSDSAQQVIFRLENVGAFPETFAPGVFDDASGRFSTGGSITVAPHTSSSRWLVVGDPKVYQDFKATIAAFSYSLKNIYPNPARSIVNFRYTVGFNAQETILLTIFDLRGRKVWEKRITALLSAGEHLITWNGRDSRSGSVGAGRYPVRMSVIDNKGNVVHRFDRVITYLP